PGRIVDIGSPAALARRHCPERSVIVVTEDATARDRFEAMPQVDSVTSEGLRFTLRGRVDDMVTHVIHCLSEHRIRVIDFRTELPTLEDVFLKLTGHQIRD